MAEEIAHINRLLSASRKNPKLVTIEATVMHGFENLAWDECVNNCSPVDIFRGNGRIFFNIPACDYEKSLSLRSVDNLFLVCHTFKKFKSNRNPEADLSMFRNLAKSAPWRKYLELWYDLSGRVGEQFYPYKNQRKSCKQATARTKEPEKSHAVQVKKRDVNSNGHPSQPVNPNQTEEGRVIHKLDLLFQEALVRLNRHPRPIDADELKETARRKIVLELENLASSLNCPLTGHELSLVSSLLDTIVESRYDNTTQLTNHNEPFGPNFGRYHAPKNKSDLEIYSELDDLVKKTMNSVFSVDIDDEEEEEAKCLESLHSPPPDSQYSQASNSLPSPVITPRGSFTIPCDSETHENCGSIEKIPQKEKTAPEKDFDSLKCKVTLCSNDRLGCSFPDAASAIGQVLSEMFGWQIGTTTYDLNVFFVFEHGSGFVTLSLTKPRRSVVDYGLNTLSAAICFNLVCLADPQPGDIVLDPMCGSCSICIEGARAFQSTYHIGGDLNERALLRTKNNIQHMAKRGETAKIDAFRWNVKKGLPFRDSSIDVIVTDLPTGLGNKNNVPLYTVTLRQLAKVTRKGTGRAVFYTSDMPAFMKALDTNSHLWEEVDKFEVFQKNNFANVCLLHRKR